MSRSGASIPTVEQFRGWWWQRCPPPIGPTYFSAPTRIAGSPARPNESPQVVACQSVRVLYLIIFPRPALPASALSSSFLPSLSLSLSLSLFLFYSLSLPPFLSLSLSLSLSVYIARCLTPVCVCVCVCVSVSVCMCVCVCVETRGFSLWRESQESRRITLQSSTCAALVRIVRATPVAFCLPPRVQPPRGFNSA